jgi:uncharacterized protein YecE (DUF72 family)
MPRARRGGSSLAGIPEPDPEKLAEVEALAEQAPMPARVANVRAGTAGWTDKTLIQSKRFYPPKTSSPRARLEHYARHFSLVEVDATYYTLLPPETADNWLLWTPPELVFDVKAHPIVTGHPIEVARLPADLRQELEAAGHTGRVYRERIADEVAREIERRFAQLLAPLVRERRLGCLMVQFPPWFTATRGNVRRLETLRKHWPDLPISIEFRHKSWLSDERRTRVVDLLRAERFSYVCVDEPDVAGGGVPPLVMVTNPELSLVRFHGHNVAGWSKKAASVHERFDYLYGESELRAWLEPVTRLSGESHEVHAIFNNCVRNYAVIDAKGLAALLEGDGALTAADPGSI